MKAKVNGKIKTKLRQLWLKAKEMGFKSPEEYILYDELRKNKIDVKHNVHLRGTEIDLYVPPKLIIEVGHRDDRLLKKWNDFERGGFSFLYFSNIEIHDSDLLKRCIEKIIEASA
jgi:hypothetical protein